MPPNTPIRTTVARWASSSNRRRLAEELLRGLALVAVVALVAAGVGRLDALVLYVGLPTQGWPSDGAIWAAGVIVVGIATVVALVRGALRYRRRRTGAQALARALDRKHETQDLLSTALAVEGGLASGHADLAGAVSQRATASLGSFGTPVAGLREPAAAFAALGIAAALVALIPLAAEAGAEGDDASAADGDALATPPLAQETLDRLRDAAQQLARFEHKPGLKDSAREKLAQIREQLEAVQRDPDRSLSTLSKAEQALRELGAQSRDGELFDQEKLRNMSPDELAEQLTRAIERGETDTASAMSKQMADRLEDTSDAEMKRMAKALQRALDRTPATDRTSGTSQSAEQEGSKSGASRPGSGEKAGGEEAGGDKPDGQEAGGDKPGGDKPGGDKAGGDKPGGDKAGGDKPGSEKADGDKPGGDKAEAGKSGSEKAGGEKPGADKSGEAPRSGGSERREAEDRARWRNKAESLSERLGSGDSGTAREELEKMAEEMRKRSGKQSMSRSMDRALSEIRKARSKQLSEMNGEGKPGEGEGKQGKGKGKGEGEGEGKGEGKGVGEGEGSAPGEGDGPPSIAAPFGPPSGKPGPGGGAGAEDTKGDSTEMPQASVYASEHVDTPADGPAQGAVRVIRRFSEGYRDKREYGELHDKYESIAESAVRSEEIPLTRRDYIRSYFQAVRGQ